MFFNEPLNNPDPLISNNFTLTCHYIGFIIVWFLRIISLVLLQQILSDTVRVLNRGVFFAKKWLFLIIIVIEELSAIQNRVVPSCLYEVHFWVLKQTTVLRWWLYLTKRNCLIYLYFRMLGSLLYQTIENYFKIEFFFLGKFWFRRKRGWLLSFEIHLLHILYVTERNYK